MRDLVRQALRLWRQDCGRQPAFERTFTAGEQSAREDQLDRFLGAVERELRDGPRTRFERDSTRERISGAFANFARGALDLEDAHLELLLNDGFSTVATQLAREARNLDPEVSAADIFQASRNAWTACGLQVLLGHEMHLTPAIFAYSMLYPYTDNYLDDPTISRDAKFVFSERFRRRLEGCVVAPSNEREATICSLVELIEDQYPRDDWPEVHASLLLIHGAQENSIRMLRADSAPADVDVLALSFEKGGASVLADAYLAAGSLSAEEERVAFEWGVLLQLVDDLQDLPQDLREGNLTIFTERAAWNHGPDAPRTLDDLTTQTLNFGSRVMQEVDCMAARDSARDHTEANCKSLREMIRMSWSQLLMWSAGASRDCYTRGYLEQLETHSPFRFALLKERRKKLARWSGPLTRMFDAFLSDEEDKTASLLLATSLVARV